jgi:hypothetical protein
LPLSFAASLGTTISIIGAPAFLVASAVLQQHGRPGLGIFSIAPIGLALSRVGTCVHDADRSGSCFPPQRQRLSSVERFRLNGLLHGGQRPSTSPLLDRTVATSRRNDHYDVKVMGWLVREGRKVRAPLGSQTLAEGDLLLVSTTPDQLVNFRAERGVGCIPVHQYEPGRDGDGRGAGWRTATMRSRTGSSRPSSRPDRTWWAGRSAAWTSAGAMAPSC